MTLLVWAFVIGVGAGAQFSPQSDGHQENVGKTCSVTAPHITS
ncbi:hypothetical protein [Lentzea californiensis]|nr:hypothetical protein [Lentzea californiensis]